MGDGNFRPPQNPHPLTDRQKLVQVIAAMAPTAVPNLVQIRPWRASGQMAEIKRFFIYTFSSGTHLQVRPVYGFSHLMAQTTHICARVYLLRASLILLLTLGVKSPKPQFLGCVNRRFQAKWAKY